MLHFMHRTSDESCCSDDLAGDGEFDLNVDELGARGVW